MKALPVQFGNKLSETRGWIMVDILIGIVIISVALVAFMVTFTQATTNVVDSRNRVQAMSIAQLELENLKRHDGKSLPSGGLPLPINKTIGIYTVDITQISGVTQESPALTHLIPVQVILTWPPGRSMRIVEYLVVN